MIDFFLHLFGLCGEPHPSLIVGGFAGYFYYIIYKISNRRKKLDITGRRFLA